MIYPLAGLLIGFVFGALGAKSKGGTGFDLAQWGAVCAIIGAVLGLFVLIFIERSYV